MKSSNSIDPKELSSLAAYSGNPWTPNNLYFERAEKDGRWLWEHLIWPFINDCDFMDVVDLLAGHGRNSAILFNYATRLIITDIQVGNIEVCRSRFGDRANVSYAVGNGYDFQPIADSTLTFIYCFDSMVH